MADPTAVRSRPPHEEVDVPRTRTYIAVLVVEVLVLLALYAFQRYFSH